MHHVQQIGSYAGFAAIVGLAVLSALYFSQARDVKRLREWAGRAPERAAEEEARIAAASATAQQQRAAAGAGGAPTMAPAPAPTTLPGTGSATPAPGQTPLPRPVATAAATPTTPILSRPPEPWYKRIVWPDGRYIALIVVGVLVIGGGAAYGIAHLVNSGGGSTPAAVSASNPPASSKKTTSTKHKTTPAINPSSITVAVLNGTTATGLANQLADRVQQLGFHRGATGNALTGGQQAESVVEYSHNNRAAAQLVGRKLGISQTEPIDTNTQQLAGDATVVVILGADKVPPATSG
jgi:hypothetical protein